MRDHDYEAFYAEELGQRAALGYPPFGRLVQALVSGADGARGARRRAGARARGRGAGAAPEVLGPAPAPLARLRGSTASSSCSREPTRSRCRRGPARRGGRRQLPRGVQASVDAFPVNML